LLDMMLANKRDALLVLASNRQQAAAKQVRNDVAPAFNSQARGDLRWRQQ
jgi:hypothetical protein